MRSVFGLGKNKAAGPLPPSGRDPASGSGLRRMFGLGASARPQPAAPADPLAAHDDLDLREIGRVLWRKRAFVILPTLAAAVLAFVAVNMITPRYKSEARIFIDGRENIFLRPNAERTDDRAQLDEEAVTSQVQLILSRDLARRVVAKEKLGEVPEFDPVLRGTSPLKAVLSLFGIGRDPLKMSPEERVLEAYYERLTAYAVDKSRVIAIEFSSRDPELAARVTNAVAQGYLTLQQSAKQQQARDASAWLAGEIDALRKKVADAEQRVEEFRGKTNLFVGANNTTLSNQQLGEINSQLASARAQKADAEARARFIRNLLRTGQTIEASDVLNSELIRRLSEQRVTLRAQLAEQSSTLLGNHPRIKELRAQIFDLDRQIRGEAGKLARGLETEAQIAGARVDSLSSSLEQLKRQAAAQSGDDVKLRALEREAKSQRELLESYLTRYREASTRETIGAAPADARIISRAIVSNNPAYPKKLPIVLIATLATLMLTSGLIAAGELLRMTSGGAARTAVPGPRLQADHREAEVTTDRSDHGPQRDARDAPVRAAEPAQVAMAQASAPHPGALRGAAMAAAPETLAPAPSILPRAQARDLAQAVATEGGAARRILVASLGGEDGAMVLSFARALARFADTVLVDLAGASEEIAAISDDAEAPGLYHLLTENTTFSRIVTRDSSSPLHLVSSGRGAIASAIVNSPKALMAIEALSRVYDHLVISVADLGTLPPDIGTSCQRAVLILHGEVSDAALEGAQRALAGFGLARVDFLSVAEAMPGGSLPPPDATPRAA